MSYPTEWWIQGKINEAIRGLAQSHEVSALRSEVDRLERSLREASSDITELRSQVSTLQDSVMQLQRDMLERLQERSV